MAPNARQPTADPFDRRSHLPMAKEIPITGPSTQRSIIFDPIQEICSGREIHMNTSYHCIYVPPPAPSAVNPSTSTSSSTSISKTSSTGPPRSALPPSPCQNALTRAAKSEALLHATTLRKLPVEDITWGLLWKFVVAVHCVHHFEQAVEECLATAVKGLGEKVKEAKRVEEERRREAEWVRLLEEAERREEERRKKEGGVRKKRENGGRGVAVRPRRKESLVRHSGLEWKGREGNGEGGGVEKTDCSAGKTGVVEQAPRTVEGEVAPQIATADGNELPPQSTTKTEDKTRPRTAERRPSKGGLSPFPSIRTPRVNNETLPRKETEEKHHLRQASVKKSKEDLSVEEPIEDSCVNETLAVIKMREREKRSRRNSRKKDSTSGPPPPPPPVQEIDRKNGASPTVPVPSSITTARVKETAAVHPALRKQDSDAKSGKQAPSQPSREVEVQPHSSSTITAESEPNLPKERLASPKNSSPRPRPRRNLSSETGRLSKVSSMLSLHKTKSDAEQEKAANTLDSSNDSNKMKFRWVKTLVSKAEDGDEGVLGKVVEQKPVGRLAEWEEMLKMAEEKEDQRREEERGRREREGMFRRAVETDGDDVTYFHAL
ncbi:unnamed protein product [Zymoseptoria tritici ST99CH_1A5]|uniref:Uncharacterized protein n=2 Tax=Zymoseptoria tritici TaxID=1047171 RepID=A0A1Y6LLS4_ZYMTR|nr:unnamed protein product [Zymoseptoria tritici ST99CH_1A5]